MDFFLNNDEYMLEDPNINKKNKKRVLKILSISSPFKEFKKKIIRKDPKRKSPSESATTFKLGTKKKGNDGNMWIVVKNKNGIKRWKKI